MKAIKKLIKLWKSQRDDAPEHGRGIYDLFIKDAEDVLNQDREIKDKKDLNYWKANAEEDYLHTPISVLRYITELETAVENCSIPDVRLSLPTDEEIKQKAFDFSYVFRDDEDCKRSDAVETYCEEMGHWIKNKIQGNEA